MIKADQETFEKMDKQYLLKVKKEPWGYQCLSNERAFYQENYPDTVIEKTGIDELMLLMIKGETV
jgi:ABC-2 type transport system ATP-binding protein